MMEHIDQSEGLFESRKQELFFYSPYSFLRTPSQDALFRTTVKEPLIKKIHHKQIDVIPVEVDHQTFLFLVEHLSWDSDYFGFPTYRLHSVLFEKTDQRRLTAAVLHFKERFFNQPGRYCFTDVPSEDIVLLQALTGAGFRLIETRMTYYLELQKYSYERYPVREATHPDIPNLRRVASEARNPFDRFHADPIFDPIKADAFLATFAEESVKGFADYTMVPDEPGTPPDAFLTAKLLRDEWPVIGAKVSKMVLSAVSSKTCKGWYRKLISEMAYYLQSQGADYAFMHPASTNKAVFYAYENLGCRLGQVTHVFSFS
jgi:dTDP-4-amino-4,6-dideoxy-D-galactose acyltransferase